jgi:hypothetical protein
MKLKTLKDIKRITECQVCGLKEFFSHLSTKDIKQEAIKRWRYFKEKYMKEKDEKYRIHYWGRMEEIKEFNNLTDEDLR